jgi:DDE superfamily endonuclease
MSDCTNAIVQTVVIDAAVSHCTVTNARRGGRGRGGGGIRGCGRGRRSRAQLSIECAVNPEPDLHRTPSPRLCHAVAVVLQHVAERSAEPATVSNSIRRPFRTMSAPALLSTLNASPNRRKRGPPRRRPPSPGVKRRRTDLKFEKKIQLLDDYDKAEFSLAALAEKYYGNRKNTNGVRHIIATQTLIREQQLLLTASANKLRFRTLPSTKPTCPEFENGLYLWIKLVRSTTNPLNISDSLLSLQASIMRDALVERLKHDIRKQDIVRRLRNHKFSTQWCRAFLHRKRVIRKRLFGVAGGVDQRHLAESRADIQAVCSKFNLEDIYNVDECALFYKLMPKCTLTTRPDIRGAGASKDRVTLLLACNATGSHKLPVRVIGRAEQPDILMVDVNKELLKYYKNTKKGWMTTTLFASWIDELNAEFVRINRKILLLLDNAPQHDKAIQNRTWTNITIHFLPPNLTCCLQPLDAGIIATFKAYYKKYLVMKLLESFSLASGTRPANVADAIRLSVKAWDEVSVETIRSCWRHAGVLQPPAGSSVPPPDLQPQIQAAEASLQDLLAAMNMLDATALRDDAVAFIDAELDCVRRHIVDQTGQSIGNTVQTSNVDVN